MQEPEIKRFPAIHHTYSLRLFHFTGTMSRGCSKWELYYSKNVGEHGVPFIWKIITIIGLNKSSICYFPVQHYLFYLRIFSHVIFLFAIYL